MEKFFNFTKSKTYKRSVPSNLDNKYFGLFVDYNILLEKKRALGEYKQTKRVTNQITKLNKKINDKVNEIELFRYMLKELIKDHSNIKTVKGLKSEYEREALSRLRRKSVKEQIKEQEQINQYDHVFRPDEDYLNIMRVAHKEIADNKYHGELFPNNTVDIKVSVIGDRGDEKDKVITFAIISVNVFREKFDISKFQNLIMNSSDTYAYFAEHFEQRRNIENFRFDDDIEYEDEYEYEKPTTGQGSFTNVRYAYNFYTYDFPGQRIDTRKEEQKFRDGLTNCLLTPIKNFFISKRDEATTKATKKNYQTKINNVDEFMNEFITGVPESRLQDVCDNLNCSIEIFDIFNNVALRYDGKNSRKIFKLINSKFNHVDEYKDIEDYNVIKCKSSIELLAIKSKLEKEKKQFTYNGSKSTPNKIFTHDTIYEIEDSFTEVRKQFSKDIDINKICGIDHINERKLSNYLSSGCHFSSCVDYVDNIDDYRKSPLKETMSDIDHEKSYTQFKSCKYYKGFMPKPSDVFRKIDIPAQEYKSFLNTVIGIFTIKNINDSKVDFNTRNHVKKLGLYNYASSTNDQMLTLPCVELLYMIDLKYTFEIVYGCFSHSDNRFDFEFTDVMKNSKIKVFDGDKEKAGPSYYAVWSGSLGHKSEYKYVYCNTGDERMMNAICRNYKVEDFQVMNKCEARLTLKQLYSYYCPQVLAFITSYARINVLSQLFEFDYKNIVRVNADAMFFKGKIPKLHNYFRNKDDGVIKTNEGGRHYINNTEGIFRLDDEPDSISPDSYIMTSQLHPLPRHNNNNTYTYMHNISLKIGCGGGGKTYSALSDMGYNNVAYVAPSHKLLRAKATEFKHLKLVTLSKLTGSKIDTEEVMKKHYEEKNKKNEKTEYKKDKGCMLLFNKYSPATIICDEITQYTEYQKQLIINTYKYSKIIFCGDISRDGKIMYQLPCIIGTKFSTNGINCIEEYNVNRRCKDDKLLKLLNKLRHLIKMGVSGDDVMSLIKEQHVFNLIGGNDMKYDINDYILCSKRNCNKHGKSDCDCDGKNYTHQWTTKYEGKFNLNKYLMIHNNDDYCNGEVIISKERPKGAIPRHAFTCHQIQGETIKKSKIFIDSRNLFDTAMLYTAISRAEYFNQIFIVV